MGVKGDSLGVVARVMGPKGRQPTGGRGADLPGSLTKLSVSVPGFLPPWATAEIWGYGLVA